MPFRIAVVGLGKIARDQHLPCIAKNRNFKLVAGVSRNAKAEGVSNFETLADLIESKTPVDAVALCTPPSIRLAMAKEALNAGYHVLIEKPPTPTVGEMQDMIAYAKKKRRVLYATWHSRYNKAVDEAKKRLKGKHVDFMRVTWKEDVNKWHPGQQWIWEPGGFGVFDPGINALSIVTKIMPETIFVEGGVIEVPENSATAIGAEIIFKRGDGKPANLSMILDWRQRGEQTWDIDVGTRDGLKLKLTKGGSVLLVNGQPAVEAKLEEYEMIYAKFARLLRSKITDADTSPLQLMCDCFMLARPRVTPKFEWDKA
jgi:D-galactose 1-dehydrogenase